MTYLFPDDDALRLALTASVVPADWAMTPVRAGRDADGRPWVAPPGDAPRGVAAALRRLGVKSLKAEPPGGADVPHWLAALPLTRDPAPPPLTDQTPVLFELDDPADLAPLVGEMLRLGNDRQGVRFLAGGPALLRVVGPPYYSLLRATDRLGDRAPRAYVERAPRVWVQVGWTHPLASLLKAPQGQMVLLRDADPKPLAASHAPGDWLTLDDAPWRDIYEVLEFAVPGAPTAWADAPPAGKLAIPLRFAAGAPNESPELWVIDGGDEDKVDALVRDSDERLLSRLAFAAGEHDGRRVLVLRARPGKAGPPVLVLDALACRPYLRLPNLFVPVGKRLRPPLRRDAVRKLLAPDPDVVTWLSPHDGDTFAAQSLPESAFRPLEQWVEYVLDRDRDALEAWLRSATFDFGQYVGREELVAVRGKPKPREKPKPSAADEIEVPPPQPPKPAVVNRSRPRPVVEPIAVPPTAEPGELERRLHAAEERFVGIDGPLDVPERQALWPELARLNGALRHRSEAALCWANALWDAEPAGGPAAWAEVEGVAPDEIDRRLANERPTPTDVRAVAALCVAFAGRPEVTARLPALLRYLEKHERTLPVRIAWLAWHALTYRTDPLALARGRDRALERLLTVGLSHEHDLPDFLRFAGQSGSDRMRAVRHGVARLHEAARAWAVASPSQIGGRDQTPAYVDLIFAFGAAKLAEPQRARELLRRATDALGGGDPVHSYLLQAFAYRVEQALAGRPHAGALPAAWLESLDHDYPDEPRVPSERREVRYKIDRMRQTSRLVEPLERVTAYRNWKSAIDKLDGELKRLPDLYDRTALAGRVNELLNDKNYRTPAAQAKTLLAALELAPRLGEETVIALATRAAGVLAEPPPTDDLNTRVALLALTERTLNLAAHYDRGELVQSLTAAFVRLMESRPGVLLVSPKDGDVTPDQIVEQCLRGMRKLGLRDETVRLLEALEALILGTDTLEALRDRRTANWSEKLTALVHVAAGWMATGDFARGEPILRAADAILSGDAFNDQKVAANGPAKKRLAVAYAAALGRCPTDYGLRAALELFNGLGWLPNTATTHSHYAIFQLAVVEAVVLAVANEEFALGPAARRWLEDDEYLVRRRIHRDMRAAIN